VTDYKEITDSITVPQNTGAEGFLHTIRELLRKPRIQEITIGKGVVKYRRFIREDEPVDRFTIEFEDLQPWAIVGSSEVNEVHVPIGANAAVTIGEMFSHAAADQLYPIAFVSGPNTVFWNWYRVTTGTSHNKDQIFGLPLLTDRHIPDTALILCAGYGRDAALVDTRRGYKAEMEVLKAPETTVEVM